MKAIALALLSAVVICSFVMDASAFRGGGGGGYRGGGGGGVYRGGGGFGAVRGPGGGGAVRGPRGNVAYRGPGGNYGGGYRNVYGGGYRPYYGAGALAAGVAVGAAASYSYPTPYYCGSAYSDPNYGCPYQ